MKTKFSVFLILLLGACNQNEVSPKDLIGKWDNTYEIRTKDESGEWTEWTTINTLVALPQLEFTSKGKLLWDGNPSEDCCSFNAFEASGDTLKLIEPVIKEECELVNCASCDTWIVEKLTDSILELKVCENSMVRYSRAD